MCVDSNYTLTDPLNLSGLSSTVTPGLSSSAQAGAPDSISRTIAATSSMSSVISPLETLPTSYPPPIIITPAISSKLVPRLFTYFKSFIDGATKNVSRAGLHKLADLIHSKINDSKIFAEFQDAYIKGLGEKGDIDDAFKNAAIAAGERTISEMIKVLSSRFKLESFEEGSGEGSGEGGSGEGFLSASPTLSSIYDNPCTCIAEMIMAILLGRHFSIRYILFFTGVY